MPGRFPDDRYALRMAERMFDGRITISDPIECWPYVGRLDPDGYGCWHAIRWGDTSRATRVVWQIFHGRPPPEGYQIGHHCHDVAAEAGACEGGRGCPHRACCNPFHLLAQTPAENVLATPLSICGANARKQSCPTHDVPLISYRSHRHCPVCFAERNRANQRRIKQRRKAATRVVLFARLLELAAKSPAGEIDAVEMGDPFRCTGMAKEGLLEVTERIPHGPRRGRAARYRFTSAGYDAAMASQSAQV